MVINEFLNDLKDKFLYDDKLINALSKIIPNIILYYGDFVIPVLEKALLECEIIVCDSYKTISMVLRNLQLTKINVDNSLIKEDLLTISGIYISNPIIAYDNVLNNYVIKKVERYIILSHTYNLDSARGLASLTKEICKLIKSYNLEYEINNNILTERIGLGKKIYEICNHENITLNLIDDNNIGLAEGINSYDEQEILKLILSDNYETFDYQNTKNIALCLKDRLHLKQIIEEAEIEGDIKSFIYYYEGESNLFSELSLLADNSAELENKKNNYNITKEELNAINKEIKYLITLLVDNLISYRKRAKISDY